MWNFGITVVGAASLFKPTVAETQHSRDADCLKQLGRKSVRHGRSLQCRSLNPELRRRAAHHCVARMTGREKGPIGMRRAASRGLVALAPGKCSERMVPAGVRSHRTRVAEFSFFEQYRRVSGPSRGVQKFVRRLSKSYVCVSYVLQTSASSIALH